MSHRITKLQRWLDLIAYLVSRRTPVAVDELMERIPSYAEKWSAGDDTARASVRRMFERDKDELRAAGIPLVTVPYTVDYGGDRIEAYRLARRDFYLPYLKLVGEAGGGPERAPGSPAAGPSASPSSRESPPGARRPTQPRGIDHLEIDDDDAAAALDALAAASSSASFPFAPEARSAFRKLAFDLDAEALVGESPVLYVDRPGAGEVAAAVRLLSDALLARKRVGFRYHGIYRGSATDRTVEPYGLLFQRAHWYLVGHDVGRDGLRVFRVGRMEDVSPNTSSPKSPDYEIPDDFDLADHLHREAWELGDDEEPPLAARVLFHFPASLLAARNGRGELVEERSDGSTVRAFEVQQANPFLRWLLTFEGEAEVLEPVELAVELRAMAREVAALYAPAGAGTDGSEGEGRGEDEGAGSGGVGGGNA